MLHKGYISREVGFDGFREDKKRIQLGLRLGEDKEEELYFLLRLDDLYRKARLWTTIRQPMTACMLSHWSTPA